MSSDRNKKTLDAIKREIKEVQAQCKNAWFVIDNSPPDAPSVSFDEIQEKSLGYVEGLRTDIQNSNTPITVDDNLLTSQFLKELKEKTSQMEEMTAFMRGCIHDTDAEINRLKTLIEIAQEASNKPKPKQEVRPEHIHKAKERFQMIKQALHGLIHSLFPNADYVIEIMGQLMAEHSNKESNGYIPITSENYQLIELLKDMKIVTTNPYNNLEVKLAY